MLAARVDSCILAGNGASPFRRAPVPLARSRRQSFSAPLSPVHRRPLLLRSFRGLAPWPLIFGLFDTKLYRAPPCIASRLSIAARPSMRRSSFAHFCLSWFTIARSAVRQSNQSPSQKFALGEKERLSDLSRLRRNPLWICTLVMALGAPRTRIFASCRIVAAEKRLAILCSCTWAHL